MAISQLFSDLVIFFSSFSIFRSSMRHDMCRSAVTYSTPSQAEVIVDAVVLFFVSLIGVVTNLISFYVLARHYVFRNPFGRLTMIHSLANVGVLLIFAGWTVPAMIVGVGPDFQWMNYKMGQTILAFQEIALHSCLFVSINRFMFICMPHFYRKHFTYNMTSFIIIFILFLCIGYWCIFFIDGCGLFFDVPHQVWSFSQTDCGNFLSLYIDLSYNVGIFVIVGFLDMGALFALRATRKKVSKALNKENLRKRNKRELRFFIQTLTNSIVYAVSLFTFDVVSCHATTSLGVFYSGTFAWAFAHMCSGLILIFFNQEIRNVAMRPIRLFRKSSTPSIEVTSVEVQTISSKSKPTRLFQPVIRSGQEPTRVD